MWADRSGIVGTSASYGNYAVVPGRGSGCRRAAWRALRPCTSSAPSLKINKLPAPTANPQQQQPRPHPGRPLSPATQACPQAPARCGRRAPPQDRAQAPPSSSIPRPPRPLTPKRHRPPRIQPADRFEPSVRCARTAFETHAHLLPADVSALKHFHPGGESFRRTKIARRVANARKNREAPHEPAGCAAKNSPT